MRLLLNQRVYRRVRLWCFCLLLAGCYFVLTSDLEGAALLSSGSIAHLQACVDNSVTGCMLYLPLISRAPYPRSPMPIGFNSAGATIDLTDGRRFLADQSFNSANGAGYVGGYEVATAFEWQPINATDEDSLFRRARAGLSAYRFSVHNGNYIVELNMAEIRHHGPEFSVFSVAIEGKTVLDALDLYALAQRDYAVRYRFGVHVTDDELNVVFSAATGEPLISAIWVVPYTPDIYAPSAPDNVLAVGGYRRMIVSWPAVQEDDVAGYHVYRADTPAGPFAPLTEDTTPLARFFDDDVIPGDTACYMITTVDVDGNESARSSAVCATAIDNDASTLPVLDLTVSAANLHALAAAPFQDIKVPATLTWQGETYNVDVAYRGATTRFSNKKSWKIEAKQVLPGWQSETLLLGGEGFDPAMIREQLAYTIYADIGLDVQQTQFVHLDLNGEFIGVFTAVENPDRYFLLRTGRDPLDDIFKCEDGLDTQPSCVNQVVKGRNMAALYEFAALVNRTTDAEFAAAIAEVLDVPAFLDYQAVKALTSDGDFTYQYLLYRNHSTGRWQVLPWDNNATFSDPLQPLDYGTFNSPGWFDQINVLLSRVLNVPQYRRYYSERVLALARIFLTPPELENRVRVARSAIWFDAQRDVWKIFREDNASFDLHFTYIPEIGVRRLAYVETAAPAYMPPQSRYISFNEVMAHNTHTIADPADGRHDPWFELVNVGLKPVDVGGMYLSDSLSAPIRFQIPAGIQLAPLSALLFWADNEPTQGNQHVNITLPASGGNVYLFDRDGTTLVDSVTYPALPADVAWGRFPDQTGAWRALRQPTPQRLNHLSPPQLTDIMQTPAQPQASNVVTITARVADDGIIAAVQLLYGTNIPNNAVSMLDDGRHGDGAANDGRFGAIIPAFPIGSVVSYYLRATDDDQRTSLDPVAAPVLVHTYRVGHVTSVLISEFMAANTMTIEDPAEPGEYADWIELTNISTATLDLAGYYLTDNLQRPTKFQINGATPLAPGEALIVWADDDAAQGPLHATFKLDKNGEAVGLFHPDGVTPVDSVVFPAQQDDVSYGRCLAASLAWEYHYQPTPGQPNACERHYFPLLLNAAQ